MRASRLLLLLLVGWLVYSYGDLWQAYWRAHREDPQVQEIHHHLDAAKNAGADWLIEQATGETPQP